MDPEKIKQHYSNPLVCGEIARFANNRWIAIHFQSLGTAGRPHMARYFADGRPLTISSPDDVSRMLLMFDDKLPRTFYATAHSYLRLRTAEDTRDYSNYESSMPTWDIDLLNGDLSTVLEAAQSIVAILEKLGVYKSIIVKWSGEGVHIHIHSGAFSPELRRKIHPLDYAYAITEYVLAKTEQVMHGVRIENKIDPQRVFTCPLSLHREVDRVCVCIDPDRLLDFSLEMASLDNFKHHRDWDRFDEGEADSLAEAAYRYIGPYPARRPRRRRVHPPLDEQIRRIAERLGGEHV